MSDTKIKVVRINLAEMLGKALAAAEHSAKMATERAEQIYASTKEAGDLEGHLAAISGMQMASEAQSAFAATVAHIMAGVAGGHLSPGGDEDCGDPNCEAHHPKKHDPKLDLN